MRPLPRAVRAAGRRPVRAPLRAAATENGGDGEREIAEDDLTTAFYRDGVLDVIDLLREQFQLALPMKPLCSEDCRGLCPELRHQSESRHVRVHAPSGKIPGWRP